jgi:spermidine synthase
LPCRPRGPLWTPGAGPRAPRALHGRDDIERPGYLTRDSLDRQWFTETLHRDFRTSYQLRQVLFDSRTPHQRLIVADSVRFGRLVALDGVTQVTLADEYAYHEMLAHVPILAHGKVEDVLIIGGGDGGMAEEVLKHGGVKRLVLVEIDAGVIDFARDRAPVRRAPPGSS